MNVIETDIPGPLIIEPQVFGDERGFFLESWNAARFRTRGLDLAFVQDNHSRSAKGVLRGLHFQNPRPQGKLVRVVSGSVWDVAVDIRMNSPTFGRSIGVELSARNKRMLWVPVGFAHGFLSLEDGTDFLYKCTDFYDPEAEQCILWNDPALKIEWPDIGVPIQQSEKDSQARPLAQVTPYD